jgi:hypothetical protein
VPGLRVNGGGQQISHRVCQFNLARKPSGLISSSASTNAAAASPPTRCRRAGLADPVITADRHFLFDGRSPQRKRRGLNPIVKIIPGGAIEHGSLLLEWPLALNAALIEQRTVAVRIAPSERSQAGNSCANLLQACHRPQAPLGRRNLHLHLDLGSREKSGLRWIVRVSGIGGEEIGIAHGVNAIYCWLHDELDPLARLLILDSDSAIDVDDRN